MNPPEALDSCPGQPSATETKSRTLWSYSPSAGPTLTSLTHPYNRVAFPHSICFDNAITAFLPDGVKVEETRRPVVIRENETGLLSQCMTRPDVRVRDRPSVVRVSVERTRVRPVIRVPTDQQNLKPRH